MADLMQTVRMSDQLLEIREFFHRIDRESWPARSALLARVIRARSRNTGEETLAAAIGLAQEAPERIGFQFLAAAVDMIHPIEEGSGG